MRYVDSSPHPSMLIESLRDFGYSLESALADVIDNSIAARATTIQILANFTEGEEFISIIDDGSGMSESELFDAMRLGSQNPLDTREKQDLGRFGLGLKTASFSQCRRLTVITRKYGQTVGASWDLDYVAESNLWNVIIVEDFSAFPGYDLLNNTGTIVVWQKLDRLTEKSDRKSIEEYFEERMTDAMDHLALVYHRFLRKEGTNKAIRISVNNRPIVSIDPFMSDHPATQPLAEEVITYNQHKVVLQGYTLPRYDRMSAAQWKRLGGKDGHIKNQGFYVYRERRLIIWGTWFGLAAKSDLNKLSRVRVDIGNDTDADWKIDVLKSSASPPLPVRARMKQIVERLTEGSRKVHSGNRRQSNLSPLASGWVTRHDGNQTSFQPNLEHPVIVDHISSLTNDQLRSFHTVITMLTSSLPMDQIHSRMSHKPEEVVQSSIVPDELVALVKSLYSALAGTGMDSTTIRNNLHYEEPFKSNWNTVTRILADIEAQTLKEGA